MKELYIDCFNGYKSWEDTGLFIHLAEEQKNQVIELFRDLYGYIDSEYFMYYMPIIVRVYVDLLNSKKFSSQNFEFIMKLYLLIDIKKLVEKTNMSFNKMKKSFDIFNSIDVDAELCRLISLDYKNELIFKYDNNNISQIIQELHRDNKIKKLLN